MPRQGAERRGIGRSSVMVECRSSELDFLTLMKPEMSGSFRRVASRSWK